MNINPRTLSPSTYQGDTRESIDNYLIVCTKTGTVLDARDCNLLRKDVTDGDVLEYMSDSEIADFAAANGTPLDVSMLG